MRLIQSRVFELKDHKYSILNNIPACSHVMKPGARDLTDKKKFKYSIATFPTVKSDNKVPRDVRNEKMFSHWVIMAESYLNNILHYCDVTMRS